MPEIRVLTWTYFAEGHAHKMNSRPEIIIYAASHKVIIENRYIVANSDKELGQTQSVRVKINTGDHPPIRLKPYRTPLHKRELVEGAVNDMLGAGVIERSVSPWSFPIVIVSKKDGA